MKGLSEGVSTFQAYLVVDGGLGVEVFARRVGDLDGARLAVGRQPVAAALDVVELLRRLDLVALPVRRARKQA